MLPAIAFRKQQTLFSILGTYSCCHYPGLREASSFPNPKLQPLPTMYVMARLYAMVTAETSTQMPVSEYCPQKLEMETKAAIKVEHLTQRDVLSFKDIIIQKIIHTL